MERERGVTDNGKKNLYCAGFYDVHGYNNDVAAGVYDAVQAAGMSFPFPQREVRILGNSTKEDTAAGGGRQKTHGQ
jgi:small-conductance mechanosensitive channel